MNTFIVIAVLTVFSFINVTNGQCTTAKGEACKKGYTDANKTTDGQNCTAAYTYGKCLVDEMCYKSTTQKSAFTNTVGGTFMCGSGDNKCTLKDGLECFTNLCSNKTALKTCLDGNHCYVDVFKTAYDGYDATCISGGCGTVTVSVLMMFLSTLLVFIKN